MNSLQRLLGTLLPRKWAEDMEAASRSWVMKCSACGHEQSIWDAGGIRWKAAGNPKRLRSCANCGNRTWHTLYRKQAV
ncbi:MAG TPA: hypothetical protein VI547_04165 [Anaerolineales bacterium]|nr:hypothetical protein [Anaerolineales bacterium]